MWLSVICFCFVDLLGVCSDWYYCGFVGVVCYFDLLCVCWASCCLLIWVTIWIIVGGWSGGCFDFASFGLCVLGLLGLLGLGLLLVAVRFVGCWLLLYSCCLGM